MKSLSTYAKSVSTQDALMAALCAALLVATVAAPHVAFAQLPDFGNVMSTIKAQIQPIVKFLRYGLAVAAVMTGFFEAFKASKGGQAKGWLNAVLLFIVAGIAISPATFFSLLGMDQLQQSLTEWGM
jgi:hypothetical protein